MVRFFAHLTLTLNANYFHIRSITTPQTIETKQRQGDKRKTKGELINTNEPFCVCVDAHPRFFLTRLRVLRMRVFCAYFGSLISELHCTLTKPFPLAYGVPPSFLIIFLYPLSGLLSIILRSLPSSTFRAF